MNPPVPSQNCACSFCEFHRARVRNVERLQALHAAVRDAERALAEEGARVREALRLERDAIDERARAMVAPFRAAVERARRALEAHE